MKPAAALVKLYRFSTVESMTEVKPKGRKNV